MNFTKLFIIASITVSSLVHAQSVEEQCHDAVVSDLKTKHYFNTIPEAFSFSLKRLDEAKMSPKMKAIIREDLYFINNRKDLPDNALRPMLFVRCLNRFND